MEFFKNGTPESMMRLVVFMICSTACIIALIITLSWVGLVMSGKTTDLGQITGFAATMFGIAITGKVGQSIVENTVGKKED